VRIPLVVTHVVNDPTCLGDEYFVLFPSPPEPTILDPHVNNLNSVLAGVTALLTALGALLPLSLVATTVNVYCVPSVKPVTVIGEEAPLAEIPPGELVAVYSVIALPPLSAGAVNVTLACVVPAVATIEVGASGTPTPLGHNPAALACI
jgi:hypothetical protein